MGPLHNCGFTPFSSLLQTNVWSNLLKFFSLSYNVVINCSFDLHSASAWSETPEKYLRTLEQNGGPLYCLIEVFLPWQNVALIFEK